MSHWRTGICTSAFWLNREQCCWASKDVEFDHVHNELCKYVSDSENELSMVLNYVFLVENMVGCVWDG